MHLVAMLGHDGRQDSFELTAQEEEDTRLEELEDREAEGILLRVEDQQRHSFDSRFPAKDRLSLTFARWR